MNNNTSNLSSYNFNFQQEVLDTFNDRVKEIELFYGLIDKFESVNSAQVISVDDSIDLITENDLVIPLGKDVKFAVRTILNKLGLEKPDIDLINIFKSNSILLLYNLIESTVSNTDRFILKTISNANVLYSESTPKVKEFWVEHMSKFNKTEYLVTAISLLDKVQTIKINIDKQYNDNEKEFQGNLDPKRVDEILSRYGIESTKIRMIKQETERTSVKNIVTWRNDLAHGKYSFAEFGRDKLRFRNTGKSNRENDILFLKESCLIFMEIFLTNVETYVEEKLYKTAQ